MEGLWLHRCAVVSAGCAFVLVLAGALATGSIGHISAVIVAAASHLMFAGAVALEVVTSGSWRRGNPVEDSGWPSLRSFAWMMPVLVLLQVALGAAYRHKAAGLMPHVIGALLISFLLLLFATFVYTQAAGHPILRRAAVVAASLVGLQIVLGVLAFALPSWALLHVGTGAMTFGATAALSMHVLKSVHPARTEAVA